MSLGATNNADGQFRPFDIISRIANNPGFENRRPPSRLILTGYTDEP